MDTNPRLRISTRNYNCLPLALPHYVVRDQKGPRYDR